MKRGNDMRIKVKNFAKIKSADIEINGITVIAGENNTGKSTIGKVMYCIFDSFYDFSKKVSNDRKLKVRTILANVGYFNDDLHEFVYFSEPFENFNEVYKRISEISISEYSKEMVINSYKSIISDYVDPEHLFYFEESIENIYTVMSLDDENIRKTIVSRVFNTEFNRQFKPLFRDNTDDTRLSLKIRDNYIDLKFSDGFEIEKYIPLTYKVLYIDSPFLLDSVDRERHLPILTTRKYSGHSLSIVNKLLNSETDNITDNIIDETISRENIESIATMINEIIHGKFIIEKDSLRFLEEGIDESIVVSNLSSGIKVFATLLRLIENGYVVNNSFIILDEPEINLHPKWQLQFAKLLVMMQKELNLHILLNSHSPYFIRAIEIYSAEYCTADKNKYYLASLNNNKAVFSDVTTNTDEIYQLLAAPLNELSGKYYD